ncbi:molybdate-anion transporter-like [Actinia tenebrosa]|uniref:Molybdate-anion transporter-like n=1 Tax=Actinia tenebrosa TaxID=6105 RepID=A0A6P8J4Z7_ACTTE|nr:molybdate-anion transporter-like [Actinia tenebrosa]
MVIFVSSFFVLIAICGVFYYLTLDKQHSSSDPGFIAFQRTYLVVYLLAQGADWLQGPHVYALYSSYGMTSLQISQLFVAGFGSSMIFGTVIGSFADKLGRKANCILYGILYGLDCLTKHVPSFWVLMIGRLLGGIATSILFSAFESWLVCEHSKRGFSKDLLSVVFSHAVLGNSVIAILAGLVAQGVASQFGFVAPFTLSLILLILVSGLVYLLWTENYGDSSGNFYKSFLSGISAIKNDSKILCLGLIQSFFEGSMYTFVLEWTPALTPVEKLGTKDVKQTIPHGWIFASYMVSIMLGSSIFKYLCRTNSPESFMRVVFAVAAMSLTVPIISPKSQTSIFIAFLVFEVCVGIFWPALGTMRSKYVPEESRATIMNMFRIPLNFIVILILLQDLPMAVTFKCCVIFLFSCSAFQHWMYKACPQTNNSSTRQQVLVLPEGTEEV